MVFMVDINWKAQISNQQLGKESNISLVFTLIRYYRAITRAEIAHKTGLSPTTISYLTEKLLACGLVSETGNVERVTVGRKPILLRVNPDGGVIASVEFLADGFNCALYDLTINEIIDRYVRLDDFAEIGITVAQTLENQLAKNQIPINRLLGISIGIPGVIDYATNKVIRSTVMPISTELPFIEPIRTCFPNCLISVGNESGFCAYAEKVSGSYETVNHLIYLDINVGVGAGIIIDNRIFTGSSGIASEIGHTTININGIKCKCGNSGCLETLVSVPAIKGRIIAGLVNGRKSIMKDMVHGDLNGIDLPVLAKAYRQRDELAVEIVHETADFLAAGINNVINLFDPQIIVLGGPLRLLGDSFLARIYTRVKGVSLNPGADLNLRYAMVNDQAVHLGGVHYALDHVIDFAHCMEFIC